jgi:hypothetical protein
VDIATCWMAVVKFQAPESTQRPIEWVLVALSLGVKQPRCEADYAPLSSGAVPSLPHTSSWHNKQTNSVARVRDRIMPTERPPLVGEVSANFCGYRVSRGQRERIATALFSAF